MQDRKCSKCGSQNVYKNTSADWLQNGAVVQTVAVHSFPALFPTQAFLCLDCHNLEIQVMETSTVYGNQRTLVEAIQTSDNWVKA
jgi:hypothetical protein